MSRGRSNGLKEGDIAVIYGVGSGWNGTRMKVTGFGLHTEGIITYVHQTANHSYQMGSTVRISHDHAKLAEGDPPPLPPLPKEGDYVEVIKGSKSYRGLQLQVTTPPITHRGIVYGDVVFPGLSKCALGKRVSFSCYNVEIIKTPNKPRKIFAKEGWGP